MLLETERAELFSRSGFSITACTCSLPLRQAALSTRPLQNI